jgi:hypothetical protein
MTQKANITAMRETSRNMYRKDALSREIAVLDPSNGYAIVTARLYYPGNTAYACIWISSTSKTPYARGTGKAGGYGYHKESAALSEAIADAGIKLSECISGRGERAMRDACEAIARAVTGKRRFIVHEAHA